MIFEQVEVVNNGNEISNLNADISKNAAQIASNTIDISNNTNEISNNDAAISDNDAKIAVNTIDIDNNADDIARNTVKIQNNTDLIQANHPCPGDSTCSNQGTCDVPTGTCVCNSGFQGDMCQGKSFL